MLIKVLEGILGEILAGALSVFQALLLLLHVALSVRSSNSLAYDIFTVLTLNIYDFAMFRTRFVDDLVQIGAKSILGKSL